MGSMLNAIFVLIVFLLTLNKDSIYIEWPYGVKENITFLEDTGDVIITKEHLHLEPIGIVLVFFFFAIVVIQFVAMLFHRFGTISHILASTDPNCGWAAKEDLMSDEALIERDAVEIVKQMQRLRGIDGDYATDSKELGERQTIHNLERNRVKKRGIGTLDVAFKKRFFALSGDEHKTNTPKVEEREQKQVPILERRETMKAIESVRDNLIADRNESKRPTINKDHHNANTRFTDTAERVFTPRSFDNPGFVGPSSIRYSDVSIYQQPYKPPPGVPRDQSNSNSSATSKM